MEQEPNRTHFLDKEVAVGLAEASLAKDISGFGDLVEELPEGLSSREVDDVGMNVRVRQEMKYSERRQLERDVIVELGAHALHGKDDLVTAQSTIKSLQRKGAMGVVGSLILRWEFRQVKKGIVADMMLSKEDSV